MQTLKRFDPGSLVRRQLFALAIDMLAMVGSGLILWGLTGR